MLQFYAGGVLMRAKGYDRPDNKCELGGGARGVGLAVVVFFCFWVVGWAVELDVVRC